MQAKRTRRRPTEGLVIRHSRSCAGGNGGERCSCSRRSAHRSTPVTVRRSGARSAAPVPRPPPSSGARTRSPLGRFVWSTSPVPGLPEPRLPDGVHRQDRRLLLLLAKAVELARQRVGFIVSRAFLEADKARPVRDTSPSTLGSPNWLTSTPSRYFRCGYRDRDRDSGYDSLSRRIECQRSQA